MPTMQCDQTLTGNAIAHLGVVGVVALRCHGRRRGRGCIVAWWGEEPSRKTREVVLALRADDFTKAKEVVLALAADDFSAAP